MVQSINTGAASVSCAEDERFSSFIVVGSEVCGCRCAPDVVQQISVFGTVSLRIVIDLYEALDKLYLRQCFN